MKQIQYQQLAQNFYLEPAPSVPDFILFQSIVDIDYPTIDINSYTSEPYIHADSPIWLIRGKALWATKRGIPLWGR